MTAFYLTRQITVGGGDDEAAAECGDDLASQDVQNRGIPSLAALT
jgi:hypothetical protein